MATSKDMENQPKLPNLSSMDFWTSNRRQYGVILIVTMANFLQGASIGTSAISVPRMQANESTLDYDDTSWPFNFVVTNQDALWIS